MKNQASALPLVGKTVYIQDCVTNKLSKLYTLDIATGQTSFICEIVTEVVDIAFVDSQLYGLTKKGNKTQLIKIDLNSGKTNVVGDLGFSAVGLSYNHQRHTLYATSAKQLIAINLKTGKGTIAVTVADKNYNCSEVAFDPQGQAYISLVGYNKKKLLASCNLDTGEVKTIGDTCFANIASLAFVDDVLYGVTGNFFNLGKDGQLVRLDTTTGKGTLVTTTEPKGRWAGIAIYEPANVLQEENTPEANKPEEPLQEIKPIKEESMNILTIDTKNNCYVIDAKQMNNLQQNVATSFTLENGTFDIKITDGSYSFAQCTTAGEPFVLLWIYGVDGSKFINKTTGYEVGATWTTLNGYNDSLQLEVKDSAVVCALFFDVNNTNNSGTVNLAITSDKPFFNQQTLTIDSKKNCYVLEETYLNTLKQAGSNLVELKPGNYRLKIREGNAKYWANEQKFNLEPWALVSVKGGKVVTKLTGIEVQETWVSLNGLKDEVILEVKEKTTLCGLFFDTYKEDNEGQIILAIESVSVTELAELYQKQENNKVTERQEEKTVTTQVNKTKEQAVTNETVTTQANQDDYKSRELIGVASGIEFSFHLNEEEFKRKWEEQWESVRQSINFSDNNVTLEGKYWDQLEQWLLRNYENQFKNLSIEVAKVRFSMDTYIQQMEFSLNEHLKSWSKHLDKLVKDKVNVEISKKINQQVNQQIDLTFEQRIRNNIGVIINNLVNKQELNQYINQQVHQSFEQTVRNNVGVIINNLVNKQELNQYIDQQVNHQVNQNFEQTVRSNVGVIINNLVNKQELKQYIYQQVNQQVEQNFEQTVRNNVDLIINNLVNKQELNQYIDQQVNQQVDQTFEQKIQNNISLITQDIVNNAELNQYFSQQIDNSFEQNFQNHIHAITQNIVNDNDVLNHYFDQRLQLAVINNTEVNNNIVNIVSNSTEINNKIEKIRNEWNQNFISLVTQKVEEIIHLIGGHEAFIKLITQNLVNNNIALNQYVSQQIDNSYEQKIQAYIKLITQNIVNDNDLLNQYFDQRLQLAVINNTEVNNNIVNLVSNSTEINSKIENIRNEWNQNFISLVTQKVEEVINIIGGNETFINLITQNFVNDNDVINQYFDQRLQQNVSNNLVINQIFENSYTTQKIENLVINSTEINNKILNFVVNSSEISNKINNVYKDIDIKIENVRNEWNMSFLSLVTQYVDEVINIIGDRDSFNLQIANVINVKVDELLSQILRIRNELTVIINNADRNLYEWTLGELMVIKGCLTDREALVEQLVTFSSQLRTKLDTTQCVNINTFKPFKPISIKPAELPIAQPQQLPGSY